MKVLIDIPDDIACQIHERGKDVAQEVMAQSISALKNKFENPRVWIFGTLPDKYVDHDPVWETPTRRFNSRNRIGNIKVGELEMVVGYESMGNGGRYINGRYNKLIGFNDGSVYNRDNYYPYYSSEVSARTVNKHFAKDLNIFTKIKDMNKNPISVV